MPTTPCGAVAPRIGLSGLVGPLAVVGRLAAVAFTFWWVCLAWIFFRAVDLAEALEISRAYLTLDAPGTATLGFDYRPLLVALGILHWLARRFRPELQVERLPPMAFAAGLGAATAIVLAFIPGESRPFVYFQF